MSWVILFAEEFVAEFAALDRQVRVELAARATLLEQFGPQLGRPWVDSLKGSRHANMKELRFMANGQAWRVAFAFDPHRRAVLLCAGSKSGKNQRHFYRTLIRKADFRFDAYVRKLSIESGSEGQ
jgi:hypothetical protein